MNGSQLSPERIMQAATGAWAAGILGAGVIHSVFTHLESGADTREAISDSAGLSARGTNALLDGLVGLGFVELVDGRYRNSPEASEFLVEGKPTYTGGFVAFHFADMARWSGMPDVVRTGVPIATDTADVPDNPLWEDLVPAITLLSVPSALYAAEKLGLADAGPISILDVGGGSGIYSAIWLAMNHQARSTQVDWTKVNGIAAAFTAEHDVGDRFHTVDGDFHTVDFGTAEHDIGVYSHIAHQETPDDNVAVFRKFRRALRPGGTLVINDFVVNDDRSGPPFPLIFCSMMLLQTRHGATWREDDYRAWLDEAGFDDVSFHPTPSPATLVLAR
ncbi:MAG: methyltransferase [Nocardioides sp.]|nr:methyltransferase [Nocardioides sp.]